MWTVLGVVLFILLGVVWWSVKQHDELLAEFDKLPNDDIVKSEKEIVDTALASLATHVPDPTFTIEDLQKQVDFIKNVQPTSEGVKHEEISSPASVRDEKPRRKSKSSRGASNGLRDAKRSKPVGKSAKKSKSVRGSRSTKK